MPENSPIRVAQFGIGPIGQSCLRTLLTKQTSGEVELVGAIDIDPGKVGRDVSELLGLGKATGVVVSKDAAAVLDEVQPDVVLHTTSSFLDRVFREIETCIRGGADVISSTEELFFPYERHPDLSRNLDGLARDQGATIVGAGVNPGFAMDTLVLMSTGVCVDVSQVHATRVVDAGKRRLPLQRKIGAGLSKEEFEERKASGTFGHIGLRESLFFVAAGLGWDVEDVTERLRPVVADAAIESPFVSVSAGSVAGIHHDIVGYVAGSPVLSLDLQMYVGARDPHDAVRVIGSPPVELVIRDGIFGDTATVATLVNAIPLVSAAESGLKTMMDLPVPRAFATQLFQRRQSEAA